MRKVITKKWYSITLNISYTLLCFIFLASKTSCKKDDKLLEDPVNESKNIDIYYMNGTEKHIIHANDTLALALDSSITIYIDSVTNPRMYSQPPVEISSDMNKSFNCYARQSSLTGIMITWGDTADEQLLFYIDISPLIVSYYIIDTEVTIDTENTSIKEAIQMDVNLKYVPRFSKIELSYQTLDKGSLELTYPSSEETVKGTFTEDKSGISMTYHNEAHKVLISYVGEKGIEEYLMEEDLTQIYQQNYPAGDINEIKVSTTILKYEKFQIRK